MTPQQAIYLKKILEQNQTSLSSLTPAGVLLRLPQQLLELNHPELQGASGSLIETLLLPFLHTTSQSLPRLPDLRYFRHREPKFATDPLGPLHSFSSSAGKVSIFSPTDLTNGVHDAAWSRRKSYGRSDSCFSSIH
jgi:hypothetical protein